MADITDEAIDAAFARGKQVQQREPRAASVRYEPETAQIVVALENGCTVAFPPSLVEGLAGGTTAQLEEVELLGRGYGLHWESLDVDLSVPGLMVGLFGTRSWMARQGGAATSAAKSAAARNNGKKGGRPKKAAAG